MCLCYLNLTALRRHDVEAVRSLAPQALAAAEAAKYPAYVAAAKAAMAWVAWKDESPERVVALAAEALELWRTIAVTFPFQWPCLWPLLSVRLAAGQVAQAVDAGRELLMPPKMRFPDPLEAALERAVSAWERGDHQVAAGGLAGALELAEHLGYA